jgi:hypothetical protein
VLSLRELGILKKRVKEARSQLSQSEKGSIGFATKRDMAATKRALTKMAAHQGKSETSARAYLAAIGISDPEGKTSTKK